MIDRRRVLAGLALARREVGLLAGLLAIALAVLAFLEIAEHTGQGDTHGVDRAVLLWLRSPADPSLPLTPAWLTIAARDVTALGSVAVLTLLVLFVAGLFAALRRGREAAVLLLASGGGVAISQGLKALFARDRPEEALRLVEAINPSFPAAMRCCRRWSI